MRINDRTMTNKDNVRDVTIFDQPFRGFGRIDVRPLPSTITENGLAFRELFIGNNGTEFPSRNLIRLIFSKRIKRMNNLLSQINPLTF